MTVACERRPSDSWIPRCNHEGCGYHRHRPRPSNSAAAALRGGRPVLIPTYASDVCGWHAVGCRAAGRQIPANPEGLVRTRHSNRHRGFDCFQMLCIKLGLRCLARMFSIPGTWPVISDKANQRRSICPPPSLMEASISMALVLPAIGASCSSLAGTIPSSTHRVVEISHVVGRRCSHRRSEL